MTCAIDNCDKPTAGKSKYCVTHKAEARERFLAMVDEQKTMKADRDASFEIAFRNAHAAGMAAGNNAVPTPMTVVQHENPFDDTSAITKVFEPVLEGVCGFAWINVKPGNSAFANWIKKNNSIQSHKSYYGGLDIWVGEFGQSYERKLAYAQAFAKSIHDELGVKVRAMGRLD